MSKNTNTESKQMKPATARRLDAIMDVARTIPALEVTSGHDAEWNRDWWEVQDAHGVLHIYIDQDPSGWGCTICDGGRSRTASLRQVENEINDWKETN